MKRILMLSLLAVAVGCDSVKVAKNGSGTVIETSGTAVLSEKPQPAQAEVTLQLKNFDELQQLVAAKKGKVVVLDVWSTYCEPCLKEFPGLVALHKKYGPEKVACVSLCANYSGLGKPEDELTAPLEFLKSQEATFTNLFSSEPDEKLYEKLNLASRSVPAILVYDREGKLAKTFDGEPTYADVEKFVAGMMN